jgi:hypothetical protein
MMAQSNQDPSIKLHLHQANESPGSSGSKQCLYRQRSQSTAPYPRPNLAGTDLPLKFLSSGARFSNQRHRIDRQALMSCAFQTRDDFPVQAAVMFLSAFFNSRCKSAGMFFKVMLAISEP